MEQPIRLIMFVEVFMRICNSVEFIAAAGIFSGRQMFAGCEPENATGGPPQNSAPEVAVSQSCRIYHAGWMNEGKLATEARRGKP